MHLRMQVKIDVIQHFISQGTKNLWIWNFDQKFSLCIFNLTLMRKSWQQVWQMIGWVLNVSAFFHAEVG